jgi:tetratricopeptide (TPR) repeat protein
MKKLSVLMFAACAFFSLISCGPQSQTVKENVLLADASDEVRTEAKNEEKTEIVPLTDAQKQDINKYSSYAQTRRQQKKSREMIEYINQIFAIDPDFQHARDILLYWRGSGYDELGIRDSALADYEKFSQIKPDHAQVLVTLDYIYQTDGRIDKAIDTVKRMIELDKEDKTLLKKAGRYHYQLAEKLKADDQNDPEIEENANYAIEYFEEYIEHVPEDEETNNLLTFLISKFLDQNALKLKLENNLKTNPDDAKTIEKLASIYSDEGNNEKAAGMLEKLLEKQPNNLKAIRKLIKINKNNIEKAISYNLRASRIDEGNEIYNINLAKLYSEKKRFEEARSECVKAQKKNPKNINVLKAWAAVYSESIGACNINIEYQDKLVFVISYGLYEKSGDTRRLHAMKESGQVPSKSDFFTNNKIRLPSRECYKWINTEWEEVKYIETFLKAL